jgi:ribosomal protein L7Ae-like RNA K-turn-binding protein
MAHACSFEKKNIPVIIVSYTITELSRAIGSKAAVLTVTDEGFASALIRRYEENQQ